MPSLKDLRNRIASVKATQKITKAMQMVAAAKLRRAQDAAKAARPYAERMSTVIANLANRVGDEPGASKLLVGTGRGDTHLLIVAAADRGLCGGFNASIARLARKDASRLARLGKTVKILCIGTKAEDALKRDFKEQILDMISLKEVKSVAFSHAHDIAGRVLDMFDTSEIDIVALYYSRFESVISQIPTRLQLLPARLAAEPEEKNAEPPSAATLPSAATPPSAGPNAAYEYEPEEEEILHDLLPRNVATQIFRALLENAASEQGARMTAMDSATRNAGEMIDKLTLSYNRQRQAQITKELIEIISGAEAL